MLDYLIIVAKSLKEAFIYTFFDHDGVEHAGFLAFLSLLSFFPFLVFLVGFAGLIGEMEASHLFVEHVQNLLPEHVQVALQPRIDEILSGPPQGLLTIAIIGIIWTASSIVEGMRTVVNRAYRVITPPAYIWRRLLSIGQFFVLTMLLLAATLMQVAVPIALSWLEANLHIEDSLVPLWNTASLGFAGLMIFVGIAGSYYILANVKQSLSRVVPGALLVLLLWMGAVELFTTYLKHFHQVNVVYGSLAGVIISLLFFFLMALIYIFGAEFNYFYREFRRESVEEVEE